MRRFLIVSLSLCVMSACADDASTADAPAPATGGNGGAAGSAGTGGTAACAGTAGTAGSSAGAAGSSVGGSSGSSVGGAAGSSAGSGGSSAGSSGAGGSGGVCNKMACDPCKLSDPPCTGFTCDNIGAHGVGVGELIPNPFVGIGLMCPSGAGGSSAGGASGSGGSSAGSSGSSGSSAGVGGSAAGAGGSSAGSAGSSAGSSGSAGVGGAPTCMVLSACNSGCVNSSGLVCCKDYYLIPAVANELCPPVPPGTLDTIEYHAELKGGVIADLTVYDMVVDAVYPTEHDAEGHYVKRPVALNPNLDGTYYAHGTAVDTFTQVDCYKPNVSSITCTVHRPSGTWIWTELHIDSASDKSPPKFVPPGPGLGTDPLFTVKVNGILVTPKTVDGWGTFKLP